MKFFFDASVPIGLFDALVALERARLDELPLEHHYGLFGKGGVPDVEWLKALKRKSDDWYIVSGDERIRSSKAERLAWGETGLTAFFLSDYTRHNRYMQASALIGAWPEIVRVAKQHGQGRGWRLPFKTGKLLAVQFG